MDKIKKKKKTDYGHAVWIWWHCIMSSGTKAQPNICVIAISKKGSLEMKNLNIKKQFLLKKKLKKKHSELIELRNLMTQSKKQQQKAHI